MLGVRHEETIIEVVVMIHHEHRNARVISDNEKSSYLFTLGLAHLHTRRGLSSHTAPLSSIQRQRR